MQSQVEHQRLGWALPWWLSSHYNGRMASFRRTHCQSLAPIGGALWLMLGNAYPAAAEFAVCNQSYDVVNVAIAQAINDEFRTEGWWTIGPNQCANVIKDELVNRYIYIYAQDVFGQPIMTGTTQMCISPSKFQILGIQNCWSRGKISAGFIEVDTEKTQRWTVFLAAVE